jgi:hypothetical protein
VTCFLKKLAKHEIFPQSPPVSRTHGSHPRHPRLPALRPRESPPPSSPPSLPLCPPSSSRRCGIPSPASCTWRGASISSTLLHLLVLRGAGRMALLPPCVEGTAEEHGEHVHRGEDDELDDGTWEATTHGRRPRLQPPRTVANSLRVPPLLLRRAFTCGDQRDCHGPCRGTCTATAVGVGLSGPRPPAGCTAARGTTAQVSLSGAQCPAR